MYACGYVCVQCSATKTGKERLKCYLHTINCLLEITIWVVCCLLDPSHSPLFVDTWVCPAVFSITVYSYIANLSLFFVGILANCFIYFIFVFKMLCSTFRHCNDRTHKCMVFMGLCFHFIWTLLTTCLSSPRFCYFLFDLLVDFVFVVLLAYMHCQPFFL